MRRISTALLIGFSIQSTALPIIGDLCRRENPCIEAATCVIDPAAPVIGRPFCVCPPGFEGDGRMDGSGCKDIDECITEEHDCLAGAETCRNTRGSYQCVCERGFVIHGRDKHCRDVNECLDPKICSDIGATCVNLPGTYTCACTDPSKEFVEGNCVAKDYCADPDLNRCDPQNGLCLNSEDGPECLCKPGFELGLDQQSCIDIDECARGEHNCPEDIAECVNLQGNYRCDCSERKGWTNSNNYECTNLNECEKYPDVCGSSLDCCKDLPPPRKFVCSTLLSEGSDLYTESVETSKLFSHSGGSLPSSIRKYWSNKLDDLSRISHTMKKKYESFASAPSLFESLSPWHRALSLGQRPGRLLSQSIDTPVKQLHGIADNLMRYTVEAVSHVVPSLSGVSDDGICPYGFVDLRPLRRKSYLQRVPETSSRLFDWLIENSPIKLSDVEHVEPAAVAVGIAQNAKNVFDHMNEWYKTLNLMPQALETVTENVNLTPGKDLNKWLGLLNKSARPIRETVETIKEAVVSGERIGSGEIF